MDPRVAAATRSVNRSILDRAVRHAVHLEALKKEEVRQVVGFLGRDVVPDLVDTVERRVRDGMGAWTTARARELLASSNQVLRAGMSRAGEAVGSRLTNLALTEAEWQRHVLAEFLPIEVSFAMPSAPLLRSIVSSRPFEGAVLNDWFRGVADDAAGQLTKQVNVGIASGESFDGIMRRVRGSPDFRETFGDSTVGRMNRNARSVVRTATSHVASQAKEETYKANVDVVDRVQIVATLDGNTTEICISLDGKVYPVGEGPRPPFHWGCRTTTVPVTKSWKELLGDKAALLGDAPPGERASMNGMVSDKLTYQDWLREQPRGFVEDVLGKGKAELFLDRGIGVDRFVSEDLKPLTLEQVRVREGLTEAIKVPEPEPIAPPEPEPERRIPEPEDVRYVGDIDASEEMKSAIEASFDEFIADDIGFDLKGRSVNELYGAMVPQTDGVFSNVRVKMSENYIKVRSTSKDRSSITRTFFHDRETKQFVVENEYLVLDDALQGKGLGTRLFAEQVKNLQALGVDEMRVFAAGNRHGTMNGYYTWARLGYDTKLHDNIAMKFAKDTGLAEPKFLSEIMDHGKVGREWWKEHGYGYEGTFDLKPGSHSMKRLEAYLKETGR